jgi:KDO2-lipid IV(A) lauroyltransferase
MAKALMYCDDLNDPQLYDRDIEVATTALNQAVEQMINRFPAEYMWGYKRFRVAKPTTTPKPRTDAL